MLNLCADAWLEMQQHTAKMAAASLTIVFLENMLNKKIRAKRRFFFARVCRAGQELSVASWPIFWYINVWSNDASRICIFDKVIANVLCNFALFSTFL